MSSSRKVQVHIPALLVLHLSGGPALVIKCTGGHSALPLGAATQSGTFPGLTQSFNHLLWSPGNGLLQIHRFALFLIAPRCRLPALAHCQTQITSSLFPQVSQLPGMSLSSHGLSVPSAFYVSPVSSHLAIILCHRIFLLSISRPHLNLPFPCLTCTLAMETQNRALGRCTRKHLTFHACPHWMMAMAHPTLALGCLTLYALHDGEDRKECSDLTLLDFVLSHALKFVIIAILLRYKFVYFYVISSKHLSVGLKEHRMIESFERYGEMSTPRLYRTCTWTRPQITMKKRKKCLSLK